MTALALAAGTAQAQPNNEVYSGRSLILDSGTVRLDLAPADRGLRTVFGNSNRLQPGLVITKQQGVSDHFLDLNIGVAAGIGDVVEIGAVALPLGLLPDSRPDDTVGNPSIYARVGTSEGDVQIAGQAGLIIPAVSGSEAVLSLGVPVQIQLGHMARISTGASVILSDLNGDVDATFYAPVELAGNVSREFFLGVNSGVAFEISPDEGDNGSIPVGAFAGYTVDIGSNSALDLTASFTFTDLLGFGASRGDTVNEENYQVIVGGTLYGDLAN